MLEGQREGWRTIRHAFLINSWYMIDGEGYVEGIPAYFTHWFCKIKIKLKIDLHISIFSSFMLKKYALTLRMPLQPDMKS